VSQPDGVTQRLRAKAAIWRDISPLNDDAVVRLVREDRIDILVDLCGHMARNRLPVFARRPAPVQVAYVNYPHSTGLETIDYRIVDHQTDPPGMTERFNTERLVRLDRCCWSWRPDEDGPPVNPLPALTNGCVTFGSRNRLIKATPTTLAMWVEILRLVPSSNLLLSVRPGAEGDPGIIHRFASHGIDPHRLIPLAAWSGPEYLRSYHRIDLCLDTFPYNGMTTTCESLWMGVPVVSLAGTTHVSRTGTSLLRAVGLEECVANWPEEYVSKAVKLARDLPRLSALRATLRQRLLSSPLTDGTGLAQQIEHAYRNMWREWCQSPAAKNSTARATAP